MFTSSRHNNPLALVALTAIAACSDQEPAKLPPVVASPAIVESTNFQNLSFNFSVISDLPHRHYLNTAFEVALQVNLADPNVSRILQDSGTIIINVAPNMEAFQRVLQSASLADAGALADANGATVSLVMSPQRATHTIYLPLEVTYDVATIAAVMNHELHHVEANMKGGNSSKTAAEREIPVYSASILSLEKVVAPLLSGEDAHARLGREILALRDKDISVLSEYQSGLRK